MNQIEIGRFIAECRKIKNMTQRRFLRSSMWGMCSAPHRRFWNWNSPRCWKLICVSASVSGAESISS